MEYAYVDRYPETSSYFQRLDARTKLIFTLVFILCVVVTPPGSWLVLAFYAIVTAVLILSAKIPPGYLLKRSLIVIPFVLSVF